MWNFYDGFGCMWGGAWFMMLFPVIITVLVIVLIVKLVQGKKPVVMDEDFSIRILKERLAKGEIDEEEYNKKMELLKK